MTTRTLRHLVLGVFALAPAAAFADEPCDHDRQGTSEAYPYPTEQYPSQTYPQTNQQTYQTYPQTYQTYPQTYETYPTESYPATTYPAATVQYEVGYPTQAPPAPVVERVDPRAGYVWTPGYYTWRRGHYLWVAGHWERERLGYRYVEGRWNRHGNRYSWVAPNWYREPVRYRAGFNWSPGRYQWRNGVQVWVGGSWSNHRRHGYWR